MATLMPGHRRGIQRKLAIPSRHGWAMFFRPQFDPAWTAPRNLLAGLGASTPVNHLAIITGAASPVGRHCGGAGPRGLFIERVRVSPRPARTAGRCSGGGAGPRTWPVAEPIRVRTPLRGGSRWRAVKPNSSSLTPRLSRLAGTGPPYRVIGWACGLGT